MFDEKDPFSNMDSNSDNIGRGVSEREKLDIDSQGMSKADKDAQRRAEQEQKYAQQGGKKGFGKFKGSGQKKERGVFMSLVIIALIVGTFIYIPMAYSNGTLANPLRSLFATPEENLDSFYGAILDMDKTVTDLDKDPVEKEKTTIYDKNNLHMDKFLGTQVEPEYMVYIYTGNYELDTPFNEWIANYEAKAAEPVEGEESEEPAYEKGKYKVYRLNTSEIYSDFEVLDYVDGKPMVLIYNTPVKSTKLLDSVVKDAKHLDEVPEYMDKMVESANEQW